MIMERLAITWHCYLLILLYLYVHLKVDCMHSDETTLSSSPPSSTLGISHPKECSALLQFKNTTCKSFPDCLPCNGTERIYMTCSNTDSWMEGKDCCFWDGVACHEDTGNVITLYLYDTCLKGTLNLSIFVQLPHLEKLILSYNSFTGLIPASVPSTLEMLSVLDLSGNMLSGQIPEIISNLSQLSFIDLSGNHFIGPIPLSLCELPNLYFLGLADNFLDGEVPSCLFTVPSLSHIYLSNNQLTGPIGQFKPTSTVLEQFYMGNNMISGSIPSSMFELVNLTDLDLSSNKLTGAFKFDMLLKFKFLRSLDLSGNSLLSFNFNINVEDISSIILEELTLSSCNIREIPSFLSSLESLTSLDLSNNRIHGQIFKNGSEGWVSLKDLNLSHNFLTYIEHPWKNIQLLDLQNNSLQGSILVPPLGTYNLLVSNNKLTGTIPPSFCNLSSLSVLDLSSNNLGGKIPKCLGSSIKLQLLHLRNNNLHGSIPNAFVNGSWLLSLDLSGNNLEGSLPRSLNSCRDLILINVEDNNISDTFPYWLGTLPDLQIIVLRCNQFYGHINDSKTIFSSLRILDLSYNKFTGDLSKFFFENLERMMVVGEHSYNEDMYMWLIYDVGGRLVIKCKRRACQPPSYYYQLPPLSLVMKGQPIKFQKVLHAFRSMDLSNNFFEGSIPEILGKFTFLIMLNLSHNSLAGNIPSSFGNMTNLESLDLSSNKLDGKIPEQMRSLTFLEVLNLSHNRLSGPIPQGGQFATFESASFIGNKGLCGEPLLEKCSNNSIPSLPAVLQEEDDKGNGFSWNIVMMGYGCGLIIGLSVGYIVLLTRKLQWLERLERIVEGRLHKKVYLAG